MKDCFTQCAGCHRNSNGDQYCRYCESETDDAISKLTEDDYDRAERYLDIQREREAEDNISEKDEYD